MFNPKEHLIKIRRFENGQEVFLDYLEIKWRLVWFREEHPDWVIETSGDMYLDEKGKPFGYWASAVIKDEKGNIRTTAKAYSERGPNDKSPNPNFVERAETKAEGRALVKLGYGTQWALEYTEENEITEVADSPVQQGKTEQDNELPANIEQVTLDENGETKNVGPSEKQKKYIYVLLDKLGMTREQYKAILKTKWNVDSSKEMSQEQVSELINYLKSLLGAE